MFRRDLRLCALSIVGLVLCATLATHCEYGVPQTHGGATGSLDAAGASTPPAGLPLKTLAVHSCCCDLLQHTWIRQEKVDDVLLEQNRAQLSTAHLVAMLAQVLLRVGCTHMLLALGKSDSYCQPQQQQQDVR